MKRSIWISRAPWTGLLFAFALGFFSILGMAKPVFACDEPKVSIGQTRAEVKARCGEPTSKEKRKEEVFVQGTPPRKRGHGAPTIEEWRYNLGPQQLIRILKFKNGRLASIETGDYGWTPGSSNDFGCDKTTLENGATKKEVREKCGKPTSISKQKGRSTEEWRYNLGPSRFVRIYRFDHGQLVEMKTGGYGK